MIVPVNNAQVLNSAAPVGSTPPAKSAPHPAKPKAQTTDTAKFSQAAQASYSNAASAHSRAEEAAESPAQEASEPKTNPASEH